MAAALILPREMFSHGIRQMGAKEAARASFVEVVEIVHDYNGTAVAQRHVEQLAVRAAQDSEAFYDERHRGRRSCSAHETSPALGQHDCAVLALRAKLEKFRPGAMVAPSTLVAVVASDRIRGRLHRVFVQTLAGIDVAGQGVVRFGGRMAVTSTERRLPVEIGDVINDRYVVETLVGEGGVSAVFGGRSIITEQRIALKCLKLEALANPKIVERFAREARAALTIKSAHVVSVHDVGTLPSGAPFLVMEYLEGRNLEEWCRERGALSVRQAAELALQMCEALAAAHARGVVHREIQPKNLFVAEREGVLEIKVLDIGISKAALTGSAFAANLPLVRTVNLAGATPLYLSPEQLRSTADVDGRSDIWSIGMVLYEVLTGTRAFAAATITESCAAILQGQPLSLAEARPDIPGGFVKITERCLRKDPAQRFQNVAELAAALTRYAPTRARASAERATEALWRSGTVDESALSIATVFSSNPPPNDSLPPASSKPTSSVRPERVASVTSTLIAWGPDPPVQVAVPRPTVAEQVVPPPEASERVGSEPVSEPVASESRDAPTERRSVAPALAVTTWVGPLVMSTIAEVVSVRSESESPAGAAPVPVEPVDPGTRNGHDILALLNYKVVIAACLVLAAIVVVGFLARNARDRAVTDPVGASVVPPSATAAPWLLETVTRPLPGVRAAAVPVEPVIAVEPAGALPPAEVEAKQQAMVARPGALAPPPPRNDRREPLNPSTADAPRSPLVPAAPSALPPPRDPISTPTPEPPLPTGRTFRRTM
jgi:serine/threonine protein kinase